MTKVTTLAKRLGFHTESAYFDYCIDSYVNGQIQQCKNLFKSMTKTDRKRLLTYIKAQGSTDPRIEYFYFDLL